ncbi:MAG: DUF1844 domain-containing protein [Planctomycetia bacterium]|nr:DUF1844 domain-containing protein [Planctomycetia bacterium]
MTDDKKIIIDEDWKSRVEAEREAAAQEKSAPSAERPSDTTTDPAESPAIAATPAKEPVRAAAAPPLPPADLQTLVGMLATQAMVTLGALPNPISGQVTADLAQARHFIDLIDMLQDKTRGQATLAEAQMFETLLHELRMAYVAMERRGGLLKTDAASRGQVSDVWKQTVAPVSQSAVFVGEFRDSRCIMLLRFGLVLCQRLKFGLPQSAAGR